MSREAMKHTPGPWCVDRQNQSPTTGEWMIAGSKPGYLAEVRDCGSGDVKANACLIAAAPDLLDALLMVLDDPDALDGRPRTYEYVRSAIAKATGEKS